MRRVGYVTILALSLISSVSALAEIPATAANGWHAWTIDETIDGRSMCCFVQRQCNIDENSGSYSNSGDCFEASGKVKVYARIANNQAVRFMVLNTNCPVTANSEIVDHGLVSAADNVAWFKRVIESRNRQQKIREEALFWLIHTESDAAYDYLDQLLTSR